MSKKGNSNHACMLKSNVVFFATANIHKFSEARSILNPMGFTVALLRVKGDEIQSDNLKDIAQTSVLNAYRQSRLPIFVEDAGLFIEKLDGFPGPYAAYVYKTIHNVGILRLMEGIEDRRATFQSVIAYLDETLRRPRYFEGESKGEITATEQKPQGKAAFGFDPIFQPTESCKTFAEMTIKEKNCYSHRAKAITKFAQWFESAKSETGA